MSPDEMTTLAVQLGRLEQKIDDQDRKLDAIHLSLKDDIGQLNEKADTTNGRVRKGELERAQLRGAFRVFAWCSPFLVVVAGAVAAHFIH